jgi:hypothetical protein
LKSNLWQQKSYVGAAIAAFALAVYPTAQCQQTAGAPADIYANFVGVWVGTDKNTENGKESIKTLRLIIEETKKKDGLKLKYEYGTKGKDDYDLSTRRITLRPATSEVTSEWQDSVKEHWKAVDLDLFAKSGLGVFYGTETEIDNKKKITWLIKFDLEQDTFRYGWFRSEDGKSFSPYSSFILRRESNASAAHRAFQP